MAEEYIPTGSFANNGIVAFKGYVKDGAFDWESAKKDWMLNDAQKPRLEAELKAAGLLKDEPAKTTQPLPKKKEEE